MNAVDRLYYGRVIEYWIFPQSLLKPTLSQKYNRSIFPNIYAYYILIFFFRIVEPVSTNFPFKWT